jgi:enterochelin esterase family protein
MLLEDFIPKVREMVELSDDPECWGIAGASSGGICAFTAAWQRPDRFRRVLSAIGSFTNIANGESGISGGHNYPAMIRLQPAKPIRVFLQDGKNDLDNKFGNWPLANQQMALALQFSQYDFKFVFGNGFHSWNHIQAISPEALKWLWRRRN